MPSRAIEGEEERIDELGGEGGGGGGGGAVLDGAVEAGCCGGVGDGGGGDGVGVTSLGLGC